MASLSLPRVLQLKKNSLDAEREQFEKFQTLAIQKAINSIETPVKEKHVRSTIIGTFQEQSAITYWMVAIRLPLQDNRIVAWKFCHVTHKLLREGHPACLDDSQRHINMIENLGKLWVHLREGYGKLVHLYTNLLVCKLKFHARNPRFPGNMQLTADELDSIAENDVNNYFQLCVELLDYMDEILNLQAAVFDSLGNARANSMTASGQCRLAALIPCAQDSSQIYDCNVRLLFRLHAALPADTLTGHRERFRQQFRKLSSFYKHASSLQYYRNLLTLPVLPSNPPNFLLQSDFGTYVAPVVSIPEPAPDEVDSVGALIDTSDTLSQRKMQSASGYPSEADSTNRMQRVPGYPYPDETESSSVQVVPVPGYPYPTESESAQGATSPDHLDAFEARATPSPQPDPIVERDRLIDHLQNELRRMRSEASAMVQERNTMLGSMREHCARLETQLQAAKTDLEQEKQKAETLIAQTPEIKQKLAETEEKAKVTDEKFQKLKGAYTQLREEHITLIRQKAEVDKLSASLRAAAAQHESAKTALQQQLNDRLKDVELLQQSASSSEEIEAYKTEIANLRSELEQSRQKEVELETIRASMEALEIENKTARVEQEEKLTTLANELKETSETLKIITQEKDERESELNKVREELVALRDKSSDQYTKVVEEKEAALKHVDELVQQHRQEKEEHDLRIKNIQAELESLQLKCMDTEFDFANQCQQLEEELALKSKELETTTNELADLRSAFDKAKIASENQALEQTTEISRLSGIVDEFNKYKSESEAEKQVLLSDLDEAKNKINLLETEASTKAEDVSKLKQQLEELSSDNENAAALQSKIIQLNSEIDELRMKLNDSLALIENKKSEYESQQKEKDIELTILSDKLKNVVECKDEIIANLKSMVAEKDEQVISLNVDVTKLSENVLRLEEDLKETRAELEIGRNEFIALNEEHDDILNRNENNLFLKNQEMRDLHNEIAKLKEEMAAEKEKYSNELQSQAQMLEARFASAEDKRLNAECELQDLLQHNTILEADVSALKRQLEDAKAELEKQSNKIVSCAGSAALEVTGGALGALEAGTAREAHAAAARRAADALSDLAKHDQIKGNEESLARSAIFAAHNTAQLSAYITEVSNLSTDMELSEKLNAECKTMLLATQECLESLKNGSVARSSCANARSLVQTASAGAAGADGVGGALSVDDELAGMDRAIEEAASQIEEMLAASRAGDSGVKLEVNGKILDACTTLMGAVKVLVQDARALQAELGDPHTRQKMYRKNPQWSEGLISAAKAVVFAAKLLVTSADEAVGAAGRLEGVSAAAHEVAGSTAQLVAASRARAPPASAPLARLTRASRHVAAATGAVVAAVRAGSALRHDTEALDTTALTLTATRRLEMESKVRSLELEAALEAERARLAALRKRHYTLAQQEENGNMTNGKE